MTSSSEYPDPKFHHVFTVPEEALDENNHVNNVVYVQWMQDVAIRHSDNVGGTAALEDTGCTWVVRAHHIEYLQPALHGDAIEAITWVADFRRVRSTRRYEFRRADDGTLLARGSTDWVFVNTTTGRPATVPETVRACFAIVEERSDGAG
jgi:acyl-CoA thioester hydrolase